MKMSNAPRLSDGTQTMSVDELVQCYQTIAKQSAEAIIRLAAIMVFIDRHLTEKDSQEFRKRIGFKKGGSRKVRKVGTKASRLRRPNTKGKH